MASALLHWAQAHASGLFGWAVAGMLFVIGAWSWLASVHADIARQSTAPDPARSRRSPPTSSGGG